MSENFRHLVNATHPAAGSRRRPLASLALLLVILTPAVVSVGCAVSSGNGLPELPPVRILILNPNTSLAIAFQFSPYPSQILTTVGGIPPLTSCTAVAGTLPAGLTVRVNPANRSQCEILTLPGDVVTEAPGTYTFTVRAADSGAPLTDTENYTITVQPGFNVTAFTLENGTVGRAFDKKIATNVGVVGGVPPLKPDPNGCTATGLPAGLSIRRDPANANGCEIFGTPTVAGTFSVVVTATDSAVPANVRPSAAVQLIINPVFVMNAFTLANGTQGRVFGPVTVTTTGGNTPITCNAGGTLPAGLSVAPDGAGRNCVISGTPTVSFGPANVTISATDTTTPTTANATVSQTTSLTVNATLDITTLTLANGTVGRAYSQTLTSVGGQTPFTWTNPGGMAGACTGLSVSAAGVVSGTPTTAGTCTFTARIDDTATATTAAGFDQDTITILVNAGILITKTTLASGKVGTALSESLTFSGGNPPVTWTNPGGMTGACAGLSLSAAGVVSGTPTTAGPCSFTARVDDTATVSTPAGFDQQTITVTINGALTITSLTLGNGTVGRAFSQTMTNTGGQTPFTWSNPGGDIAAGACAGLSISAAGLVSGTPTTAGTCTFTGRVDDTATGSTAATFDQQSISMVINAVLAITSTSPLPDGVQGRAYNLALTMSGGQTPFTWTNPGGMTGACAGLTLSAAGVLSGTPTTAGACAFNARVDDTATVSTAAGFAQTAFNLTVQAPLTAVLTQASNAAPNVNLHDGVLGRSYGTVGAPPTWNVSGGIGPYAWCIFSGTTPGGMTGISANCGAPTAAASVTLTSASITGSTGLFTFSVRVIDTGNAATAAGFDNDATQININPALSFTENTGTRVGNSVTIPDGVEGRPHGSSPLDLTRVTYTMTAGNGIGPYSLNGNWLPPTTTFAPSNFTCNLTPGVSWSCGTFGLPVGAGGAAASPYLFFLSVTDAGNPAVPADTVTVNHSVTFRTPLALARNMVPPDAVVGRTYGQPALTPIIYTASAGLSSAGGVNFSVPANQASPGAGFPNGFTCTPAGLTMTCGSAGGVAGTAGTYTPIQVFANDSANATTPASGAVPGATPVDSTSLTVQPVLTVTAVALANGTQSRVFGPVNVPFAGGLPGVTCSGTGLPTGMTVPGAPSGSNCQINNTPTVNGPFSVTVTATDTANLSTPAAPGSSTAMPVTINAPLAITTVDGTIPAAVTGAVYPGFTFANSGGQTPFIWSNPGGSGVSLNTGDADCAGLTLSVGGAIGGTPTAAAPATCTFTARVDDTATTSTAAGFASGTFNIQIVNVLTVVAFTPVGNGTVGRPFQLLISVAGGDGTLRTDPNGCAEVGAGTLPAGLSITRADGGAAGGTSNQCEISGTPTTAGTSSNLIVRVSDQPGSTADSASFSITINAALSLAAFTLTDGTEGRAFGDGLGGPFQIAITGGQSPYTCDVDPASTTGLPAGVSVTAVGTNCEISGTPSAGAAAASPYNVTIRVRDTATSTTPTTGSNSKTSPAFNVNLALAITQGVTLPEAVEGRTYNLSIAFSGGQTPFTWSDVAPFTLALDPDCAGLSLSSAGDLTGTPTATGPATCTFTARVDDTATTTTAAGNDGQAFTLTINPPLAITTTAMPNARRTSVYFPSGPGVQLALTGGFGAKTWSAVGGDGTSLNLADPQCAGLSISSSGVVTGTPTNAATDFVCSFTAQVDDTSSGPAPAGNDTQALTIVILNTFAYTAGNGTSTVEVINISTNAFVQSIAIAGGRTPDQVAITADGRFVYVTSPGTDELIVIDASTNTQVSGSPFDISVDCTTPRGIASNNQTGADQRVYIACAGNDSVVAVDANPASGSFNTVVATITPVSSGGGVPERIAFSPDGLQALVTISTNDEIAIIDTDPASGTFDTVVAGPNTFTTTCTTPMGVVFANDGLTAFVACAVSRAVSVIDTDSTSGTYGTDINQTTRLLGGTGAAVPDSIAITPNGAKLYVTLGGGGGGLPQISIVDTTTLAVVGGPAPGADPQGVPCLAGGCFDTGNLSPIGIVIPPFGTNPQILIAMSGDASDSVGPTQISPGVAILVYTAPSTTTEGTNNPIVYATTTTAPRGIAFIPIPR